MQDPNIENTQPSRPDRNVADTVPTTVHREAGQPLAELDPTQALPVPPRRPRRWPWVLLGILLVLAFTAGGAWLGYRAAIQLRTAQAAEARVSVATEHFMAGLVAQQNKQYEIAREQFEFVIKTDPTFPGAQDKLREVMIEMAVDKTPTPIPTVATPTLTPTLDTRPQEDIFNQLRQQYAAKDWDGFFATVDALRRIDPSFHAVEVDGMLYFAYRFRGIEKIIYHANLEGGLYDLALSERFGPLDVDSLGYRNWARMYLNGASFWQIDWLKVIAYFEEIYPYFPNMRDSSGMTAIERYRIAARSYGDKLYESGDYCGAYDYYAMSLQAVPDGALELRSTEVWLQCHPPTSTPTVTPTLAPTVQNTIAPTAEPTQAVPPTEQVPPTEPPPAPTEPAGTPEPPADN
jgi:tetratricopeptide (TPR) repeat protein